MNKCPFYTYYGLHLGILPHNIYFDLYGSLFLTFHRKRLEAAMDGVAPVFLVVSQIQIFSICELSVGDDVVILGTF